MIDIIKMRNEISSRHTFGYKKTGNVKLLKELSLKKKSFNESFEYLNYFYNCSINQDSESFLKELTEGNFIKKCFYVFLFSLKKL